ncbi:MAG: hypothetical protein AAF657_28435 [Acidobacteriota bacterium]
MQSRLRATSVFASALLIACILSAVESTGASPVDETEPIDEKQWSIERKEWNGELAAGYEVEIINPYGDIRVRHGAGRELYFLATVQGHQDDPRKARVEAKAKDSAEGSADNSRGTTRIEVEYPNEAELDLPQIPASWNKRRVDLTVFVPIDTDTTLRTLAGLAEVRGLEGDLDVSTETGDMRLRIAGGLRAKTVHGDILAQFRRTRWQDASRIESLTGTIRAELPSGGRAEVELETRGEITTDYSITIRRSEKSQLKQATAKIGVAGPSLSIKSNKGPIKLIESIVPEAAPKPKDGQSKEPNS